MQRARFSIAALAAVVSVAGCQTEGPTAPGDVTAPVAAANSAPALVSSAGIFDEFQTGSGISGDATLTRSKDGLWLTIDAENLVAGHAHTVWWVIFDNPRGCSDDDGDEGCGLGDLGRRSAQVTLVNGNGFVADGAGTSAGFETHLARHDVGGRQLLLGDPSGVDNPLLAEVHVIILSHGEAEEDPADLALQTSTVDGFCNLPGGCLDVGVVVFPLAPPPGKP